MQPTMTAARKDRSRVFLMPQRMPFISGITNRYDDDFPIELDGLVTEAQFSQAINQINNTLTDYWPCLFCVCCGYLCCVCTAGLSLLCPNMCISDAEQYTRTLIERINARPCFKDADVEWKLVKKCCRSWIEISLPIKFDTHDPVVGAYQTVLVAAPPPLAATSADATLYGSAEGIV
ncbi:hypothetical protein, variant [Aphanomyces invadans]|uniref:Golgin subfamily A member 7/ERF4 domain-containing protein n=1 Tax=Aphanomyces invadans TaxID=157072 RepID=A0A024TDY6_9STRA|nr:hypothetical protein, variant [Aphanomyces invadans]ETV92229.1 hypothetical protein, variant [Aphanomyces invadans]|eukprot:XP_008879193.1 hypothetical protein, variant [Aphanomyces invadans]